MKFLIPSSILIAIAAMPLSTAVIGAEEYQSPEAIFEAMTVRAGQGDVEAMRNLGDFYQTGYTVDRDYGEAFSWYNRAAGLGDAAAQTSVGLYHELGRAVARDADEAFNWYLQATEQGFELAFTHLQNLALAQSAPGQSDSAVLDRYKGFLSSLPEQLDQQLIARALYNLGENYYQGQGVAENFSEAFTWYELAAKQGYTLAADTLAQLYDAGEGVPQDTVMAYAWWSIAAAQDSTSRI